MRPATSDKDRPTGKPPVETLPVPAPGVVRIRLLSPDLMFTGPAIDPFHGSFDGLSGMDHLAQALKREWGSDRPDVVAVEWVLPADLATEQNRAEIRAAMAGWCAAQVAVTRNALLVMAKERRRAWQTGGAFFALCFVLATVVDRTPTLSDLSGALIAETFVIAGWVGVWRPLELTMYAWWPHHFRLRLLDRTGRLDVRLLADDR